MQLYSDIVTDQYGNVISGATVLISQGGSPATIYSDNGVTPKTNPVTTDTKGEFSFYAAGGTYIPTVTTSAGSVVSPAITLFDPADLAASTGAALVGSNDGASGSLWTTVAGFIAKIISSAGASVIGFIDASVGGVRRTVEDWMKDRTSVFNFMTSAQRADVRAGTRLLDVTTAIQAAIDALYLKGGGELYFPLGGYLISDAILVPQRVTLVGEAAGFVNQFVSDHAAPKGSHLFVAAGSDCDGLVFRCLLTNNGGTLEETTLGGRNSEARHAGGARNLTVWGNRSADQAYTAKDLNATGVGVRIQGSRYVTLENVFAMFFADDGVKMESYDYGTGEIPSNNAKLIRPNALSNGGHGLNLAGGDNIIESPNCGYNAIAGIQSVTSGTLTGGLCWNNGKYGFSALSLANTAAMAVVGLHCYDNDETGFRIGTGRAPTLTGCVGRGNGRDTGAGATDRSNFLVGTGAEGWSLAGCRSHARDQDNVLITQYGFYINNTTYSGTLDGCTDEGSATPSFIADGTKIIAHGGTATTQIDHPGFRALGHVDMNQKDLNGIGRIGFTGWTTVSSITANSIPVTTFSLITLNCTGAQTVNDLAYSGTGIPLVVFRNSSADAVTFTHNSAKLRCANATNVVLAQYESVMFLWVSGTVWQQVGGAS